MGREHPVARGRDQELAALRGALTTDAGRMVVLRGPVEIGRTTLLEAVARRLSADGLRVITVHCGISSDGPRDRYGIMPMVHALRENFERFGDVRLADSLNAIARLRDLTGQNPDWWVPRMISELDIMFDRVFDRLGRLRRTAILVDDAHLVDELAPLLTSARRAGCPVLVTCRDDVEQTPGLAELLTMADEMITLGPLADEDMAVLADRAAGTPLDEAVLAALRTALGPLFGNPGTLLATVRDLRASGRLTLVRDRLCLRAPTVPIALPVGHHLVHRARELGVLGRLMLAVVATLDEFSLDDLPLVAAALHVDLVGCGHTLDQLILSGVLVTDRAGQLRCRCPALAAYAVGQVGNAGQQRMHTAIAGQLLAHRQSGGSVEPVPLADHIAHAGVLLTVDPETIAWLVEFAATIEQHQPERAALWYAAALRRISPDEAEHARILAVLVSLVVRTGQYELLTEVLARQDGWACGPASLTDLRAAAVMVTLHTSTVLSEPTVRTLLDEPALDGLSAGFAEWWFGHRLARDGEPPVPTHRMHERVGTRQLLSREQADLLLAALSGVPDTCARAWRRAGRPAASPLLDRLREAAAVFDLASVFQIVFGPDYRVPEHGVVGAYRRVVRGYAGADWSRAMSAVRELESSGGPDTVLHQAARLYAAEICGARGQSARAAEWLADAQPVPSLAALRAWVELGLVRGTPQAADGVRAAHKTYRWLCESGLRGGLELLLQRAVATAVDAGEQALAVELLGEIEHLHRRGPCATTMEVLFQARGLINRDMVYTKVGADLARSRADQPQLMTACMIVAGCADDPQPWLQEAYEIALRCDATPWREEIREMTRKLGAITPRSRGRKATWSASELRMIELIRDGRTNRQIAIDMRISEKTVENRLSRLFARTGCRSRVELVAASLEGRLLEVAS